MGAQLEGRATGSYPVGEGSIPSVPTMSSNTEHMKKYMKQRYNNRKELAIKLLGGRCCWCGTVEHLQFDHADRKLKHFTICKKLAGVAKAKLAEELSKCQLLCATCHLKKSLQFGDIPPQGFHGVPARYNAGCRCVECKTANSLRMKRYPRQSRSKASVT